MPNFKKIDIYIGEELYNSYNLNFVEELYEYIENDTKNYININDNSCIIVRENNEFNIEINSEKPTATYTLKEENYILDINIDYFDIFKEEDKITIYYQLETNEKAIKLVLRGE